MEESLRRGILVDINLAIKRRITFYQTWSNAIILQETLPAYCVLKVVRLNLGEVLYEKVSMSPRPPPKIYLIEARMDKRIGFESCSTTRRISCSTTRRRSSSTNRRRSCSTSKILPTNPTNSKSNSWQIGATWWHARWKKHVPFSGDQC